MPSTGAAATYTRMKRGTENTDASVAGYVASHILGRHAAEMTAICSQSPGPLQLLPAADYGMNWLQITDRQGNRRSYPKSDPYSEIYLNNKDWWALCEPHLLNPNNKAGKTSKSYERQLEKDWKIFKVIIEDKVKGFHRKISGQYHPNTYAFYGIDPQSHHIDIKQRTHQQVHWRGELHIDYPEAYRSLASKAAEERLLMDEVRGYRTVQVALTKDEQAFVVEASDGLAYGREQKCVGQHYSLQPATENGDGTVPERSGFIADQYLKSRLVVKTEH